MIGRSDQARAILAERSTLRSAEQFVTVLGNMKGAAMKLGQMLSVLDLDFIPESHRDQFREELAALHDQAPAVPFEDMRKVVESDLGPLAGVFADFDEDPIAAASIGQVFRAQLLDGRQVAVKVQYPGIDKTIRADMRNLALFAKLMRSAWPTLEDSAVVDEVAANLESELDYMREAQTQHALALKYAGHPFISVPDSILTHCSRRVLVTEYVSGSSFDSICALPVTDRDKIGELIYRFYIGSMFNDNEFCGDPHPGNVLLNSTGGVTFIDFGLYKRMDKFNVDFERQCLRAAAANRADDLYRLLVDRGIVDPTSEVTPQECLTYTVSAAEWHMIDQDITITPALATGALILAIDPRVSEMSSVRNHHLPPEHLLSRRVDFFTFGLLGQLGATNNWHRIAREWLYHEPPTTAIGLAIAEWNADK